MALLWRAGGKFRSWLGRAREGATNFPTFPFSLSLFCVVDGNLQAERLRLICWKAGREWIWDGIKGFFPGTSRLQFQQHLLWKIKLGSLLCVDCAKNIGPFYVCSSEASPLTSPQSLDGEHKTYNMLQLPFLPRIALSSPGGAVAAVGSISLSVRLCLAVAGQIKGFSAIYTTIIPVP